MELPRATRPTTPLPLVGTGVPGLDNVLGGGLTPSRLYLIEGTPGAGKTTIALQFLMEGVRKGESVLYITLSETDSELQDVSRSHGWDLTGIHMRELLPNQLSLRPEDQYTMFHPSEVELGDTTLRILADVEKLNPTRVVFDSLSELRLLAGNSLRYRRQILALKQFFSGRTCTVLLLDDLSGTKHDLQVKSIAHAVLRLEQHVADYGTARRRLIVEKYRGRDYRGGFHDYKITHGGLVVFPRLVAAEHFSDRINTVIPSGIAELDELMGGGVECGTSTLFVGAPGTGKSTVAVQFALSAAKRGQHSALFIFDESINTLRTRCEGMGMDLGPYLDSGLIKVRQVDPAELSPGELIHEIRHAVTEDEARIVVIDSLNGYLNAMPDQRFLVVQLHELLTFLGQSGVATLLIGAQHGLIGAQLQAPVDASYLADSVVMLRYYEAEGEVRQAISVIKKRGGAHERSIRPFLMTRDGITVGPTLRGFRGILTGVPLPIAEDSRSHGLA
ncbi:ATPase domain-containing protein [Arenimonas sp. MALMAid1274]|uniref:ATPase domain-containing protein n=1 Tax=Arenimonas sp. MALMAid1274 TaxID=3411630 RepID=UPI003B9FDC72